MTRLSFTQSADKAFAELQRLEGIKNRLAGLILDLQASGNPASQTWIKIYTDRLNENVRPAIREVHEYLREASMLDPATHGLHS